MLAVSRVSRPRGMLLFVSSCAALLLLTHARTHSLTHSLTHTHTHTHLLLCSHSGSGSAYMASANERGSECVSECVSEGVRVASSRRRLGKGFVLRKRCGQIKVSE